MPASLSLSPDNSQSHFKSFMADPENFLRLVKVPDEYSLSFEVEGIPFNAQHITTANGSKLVLWSTLGILPFTVVNAESRHALIHILESARNLPTVMIGIDKKMQIIVRAAYDISQSPAANYLFAPLVHMMQEARPYIRLVGEYL